MKPAKKTYYCYIMRCADGSFYTGMTTDIAKREQTHNNGNGSKYVHAHGGGKMVYTETCSTRSAALIREAAIKKFSRERKEKLIESYDSPGVHH